VTEWKATGSKLLMGLHALLVFTWLVGSQQTARGAHAPSQSHAAQAPSQSQAAHAPSQSEAYFLFLQGHWLEGNGDVAGAIDAYKQAIVAAPQAADIRAELAGVYARAGRTTEAVDAALDALKVDVKNAEGNRILGLVQASMADTVSDATRQANLATEAIGHLELALATGSHDLASEMALGRLYVQGGQYSKGIAALRAFLNDRPGYPEAVMMLADALDANHQSSSAVDTLNDYLRDDPSDVKATARLAELHEQAGRWNDAAQVWGTLATQKGATTALRLRYASALVNSGDLAAGRDILGGITKDAPRDVSAWYLTSEVAMRAGDASGAESAARQIAEIDPKDPRGPLALADAKTLEKDYTGAAATLEPLVAGAGAAEGAGGLYGRYATTLAGVYAAAGDRQKSVQTLETARTRAPEDTAIGLNLAAAYDKANKVDQAEAVYRDLIKKDPENAEAMNDLGYMLAERDRKLEDAVNLIKQALAIETDKPEYLDSLGWAYFKQGKADLARDPLERAAAAQPRASVIQSHLAEAYFRLKRYADAAATWDRALAGDHEGIDVPAVTQKRDKARQLAK
jgi:tetratricopeptide (TPR) repeat protein